MGEDLGRGAFAHDAGVGEEGEEQVVALAVDTEALSPAELNAQMASRAFRLLLALGDEPLLRRLLRPAT